MVSEDANRVWVTFTARLTLKTVTIAIRENPPTLG
jgi:hypothetical protein